MRAILDTRVAVGDRLPECSHWYRLQDFVKADEKTIHTDQAAAEREGLAGPVAIGPQVAALIFRMLRQSFGPAWANGTSCSLTFRRPVPVDAFCTAAGEVTAVYPEDGRTVVECNVWVEDRQQTKVIVGTARSHVEA